jgi:hypothetical protein
MKPKFGITVVAFLLAASTGTFAADSTAAQGPQIAGSATGSSPCQPGKMGEAEKTPGAPLAKNSGTNGQPGKMGGEEKPAAVENSTAKGC